MGDGGVACAPTQLIMDKFPVCGGKTDGKLAKVKKPKMKPKKGKGRKLANKMVSKEVAVKDCNDGVGIISNNEDEVEEGELGTLPIENVEYEIKSEIEMGEFVPERNELMSPKDEVETGEFVPERWCKSAFGHKADHYGYSKTQRYDREWAWPPAKERGWDFDRDTEWKEKGWKTDYE